MKLRNYLSVVILFVLGLFSLAPQHALAAASNFHPEDSFSDPISLGQAVKTPLSQAAAYGQNALGETEQYMVVNGSPAVFYAVDAETGEQKFSQTIANSDVVWGMTVGSDGNVYFASTMNGMLYRYLPNEKKLESLGKNPSDTFVWDLKSSSDGKIYGATYPNTKVFEYDIATNTYNDLGIMKEGQQYARGLGVTDQYVYVGIGTTAALMRYDRKTGEKVEIPLPISGESATVSEVTVYGGKLFVRAGYRLFILDEATGKHIKTIGFQGKISSPSPYNPDLIYYKVNSSLYTYNLKENKVEELKDAPPLPDETEIKAHAWITLQNGKTVLAGMAAFTDSFFYNPTDNDYKLHFPNVDAQGTNINAIAAIDGKVYSGGYQRGMSIFDESSQSYTYMNKSFHQSEGIGSLNGVVYFGTYPGAKIYRYDPTKPINYTSGKNGNPSLAVDIDDDQDRPFAMTSGDNKLFIGTIPGYGKHGGALTVLSESPSANDQVNVQTKVYADIVKDQSIIGLAYKDGKIYGSTSIYGGLGSDPVEKEAKMFVFDVEKGEKIAEFTPKIPGLDIPLEMIGGLSFGPDGLLWGIIDGTIFAMDPTTYEVVKSKIVYPTTFSTGKFRPFYLDWGKNGTLYTTLGRKLTAVNPDTLEVKQLVRGSKKLMTVSDEVVEESIQFMTLSNDGSIYYTLGSRLYKLPIMIESLNLDIGPVGLNLQKKQVVTPSPTVQVKYVSGAEATLTANQFKLVSSNPDVISISDSGEIVAKSAGIASVMATSTSTKQSVTSNEIPFVVTVTMEEVKQELSNFTTKAKIRNAFSQTLQNDLQAAESSYNKGDITQGIKVLTDMTTKLQSAQRLLISIQAQKTLINDINSLKTSWQATVK
ncbi:FIMAH domain-containing protein [Priestia koreensis]|uniref:FIMAH domain-containing protein n=1 Tax=Priestia koreensis TaxID=284581 RepID=UPI0028F74874|nr:hypothetical protein [Priestia koreensis]